MKLTLPHIVSYVVAALAWLAALNPAIATSILGPTLGHYGAAAIALAGSVLVFIHDVYPSAVPAAASTTKQSGNARVGLLACLASAMLVIVGGCAAITKFEASPTGAVVISAAVDVALATVESKGITQTQINGIAKQALAADSGTPATIASLSAALNEVIAKANIPAGDQAAAYTLEIAVSAAIKAKLSGNATVAAAQAATADILNAIIAATGG